MSGLIKKDFNEKYRFRESRREGLVNCVTCDNMAGGTNDKEGPAFCEHEERFRKIKIAEYSEGFWGEKGTSYNIASKRVCDAYASKPLPEGIEVLSLEEGKGVVLGSQRRDIMHADLNCPYVIEELRALEQAFVEAPIEEAVAVMKGKKRFYTETVEIKGWRGALNRGICEMPCCDSKIDLHPSSRIDDYRRKVGIKPDGTEEWVRPPEFEDHEIRVRLTEEDMEKVFDLSKFDSRELKFSSLDDRIDAVKDHLNKNCNRLGSKDLSEVVNPISFYCGLIEHPSESPNYHGEDFWISDERLFNWKEKPSGVPIRSLEKPLTGAIRCVGWPLVHFNNLGIPLNSCTIYGNIRHSSEGRSRNPPKWEKHFIEVRAVAFSDVGNSWRFGVIGEGFNIELVAQQ